MCLSGFRGAMELPGDDDGPTVSMEPNSLSMVPVPDDSSTTPARKSSQRLPDLECPCWLI